MGKYLDSNGLTKVWGKVTDGFIAKTGTSTRPKYNNKEIAMLEDVPQSSTSSNVFTTIKSTTLYEGMSLTIDVSNYTEIIVTIYDIQGCDQPSGQFNVGSSIWVDFSRAPLQHIGEPQIVRLVKLSTTNLWLLTSYGGSGSSFGQMNSTSLLIKCSASSQSEQYEVDVYAK